MTNNEWIDKIYNIIRPTLHRAAEFDPKRFAGSYWLNGEDRLVACTDGVGSKTKLAFQMGKLDTIGIDLVAMNVNDLIADFAHPMFFLDYIGVNSLDKEQLCDILTGIAEGCKQAQCSLIGGETAEIPATYPANDASLVGFAVGMGAESRQPSKIEGGEAVIAYPSSGLHSNGFTLIHKLIDEGKLEKTEDLLTPTIIYTELQELFKPCYRVKAFAHITGGGLRENISRLLPKDLGADIRLSPCRKFKPKIYDRLKELVPQDILHDTFNMGIGFVAIVEQSCVDLIEEKTSYLNPVHVGMINSRAFNPDCKQVQIFDD